MATFQPPIDEGVVPRVYLTWPDHYRPVPRIAQRLFARYKRHDRGRNVYLLTDNTVTEEQPSDMSTVQRIFYGGHIEPVNAAEEAILVAAGYTVEP